MELTNKPISEILRNFADLYDNGQCNMSQENINFIAKFLGNITTFEGKDDRISRVQAFKILGIGSTKFNYLVKNGYIPQGEKVIGFKELFWHKSEIQSLDKEYLKSIKIIES